MARRYERIQDKQHRFWEISVVGPRTITVSGVVNKTSKTEKLTWADSANATAEAKRMILQQVERGFAYVGSTKDKPAAKSAVSKTSPSGHFEEQIRKNVGDRAAWLVYADWLTEQGDPRGELIVVQEGLSRKKKDRTLLRLEEELLEKHYDVFVGDDLADLLDQTTTIFYPVYREVPTLAVTWKNGFFAKATLQDVHDSDDDDDIDDEQVKESPEVVARVTQLLDHPSSLFLGALTIHASGRRRYDLSGVLTILTTRKKPPPPPPIAKLRIGDKERPDICMLGNLDELLATYTKLEHLELHGVCDLVQNTSFPATLEHLVMTPMPNERVLLEIERAQEAKPTMRVDLGL